MVIYLGNHPEWDANTKYQNIINTFYGSVDNWYDGLSQRAKDIIETSFKASADDLRNSLSVIENYICSEFLGFDWITQSEEMNK